MRRILFLVGVLFSLSLSHLYADDTLDIQAELSKPGVKLVAVDFFSINCPPCMKAMPKWAEILKKYRSKGLRFITVSAEKSNICTNPGWSPDRELCDPEGTLQQRFAVNGWPTYLLYSWDGNVNIVTHDVKAMESEIEGYFKDREFRLQIDDVKVFGAGIKSNPVWVQKLVEAEVNSQSKFHLVSTSNTPLPVKEADFCDEVMGVNSILRIMLEGDIDGNRSVTMSIEKDGCKKASVQSSYLAGKNERENLTSAVKKAVFMLLSQVVKPMKPKQIGKKLEYYYRETDDQEDWFVKDEEVVVVSFKPDPSEAIVLLDGQIICQTTPCSDSVSKGLHQVSIQKKRYTTKTETIDFKRDTSINWKLQANFGSLLIDTHTKGLKVKLDGRYIGKTPLKPLELAPKVHKIEIVSGCFYPISTTINVKRGKLVKWKPDLKIITGGIKVLSKDLAGNVVRANVYIDGKKIGQSPATFKVPICARSIEVKADDYTGYRGNLSIKAKEVTTIEAQLESMPEYVWGDVSNKLMWQVNVEDKVMNWQAAKQYCEDLRYNDYSDWRLPKRSELRTLLKGRKVNKCNWVPMVTGNCGAYWTASSYNNSPFFAWSINFSNGSLDRRKKTMNTYYVRCVR